MLDRSRQLQPSPGITKCICKKFTLLGYSRIARMMRWGVLRCPAFLGTASARTSATGSTDEDADLPAAWAAASQGRGRIHNWRNIVKMDSILSKNSKTQVKIPLGSTTLDLQTTDFPARSLSDVHPANLACSAIALRVFVYGPCDSHILTHIHANTYYQICMLESRYKQKNRIKTSFLAWQHKRGEL